MALSAIYGTRQLCLIGLVSGRRATFLPSIGIGADSVFAEQAVEVRPAESGDPDGLGRASVGLSQRLDEGRSFGLVRGFVTLGPRDRRSR